MNTFYSKLVIALLSSFILIGLFLIWLAQQLTQEYQNEVEQKLHLHLAEQVVSSNQLLKHGKINTLILQNVFHRMMILGPSFEFYVLDTHGKILAYSAEAKKIKRQQVNLSPINKFISNDRVLPITGEDPRSEYKNKIFSAATINENSQLVGYLYIIIGGEIYDNVVTLLQSSHIVKLSFWLILASLIFGLIIVLGLFALLTKPLRKLTQELQDFHNQGFDSGQLISNQWNPKSKDEIQRLGSSFTEMAIDLKRQYQKVKSTDELRKELLSYISHDIRTPLASTQGYLETWQLKKHELSDEDAEKFIQIALKNTIQMKSLVEQLFELAHLDGKAVKINKEPIAIAELSQDVIQKFQLETQQKNIQLEVQPQDPSFYVMADIEKLERILTNLIDNAIRHSQNKGKITLKLTQQESIIDIEIKDNGIGIPEDEIEHIFEAHFKASNSVKCNRPNSGLGLAITRRLLELHDSKIQVRSKLGHGTTFYFSLQCYN